MADHDAVRQRIIASVFDKRNAATDVSENYVAHIKIWEDAGEGSGKKPRYILLSRCNDGSGFIHKSKLNTNGSFSVGKSWKLTELRGIEVNSSFFSITMARTYKWQTENGSDQSTFISAVIKLHRTITNGAVLQLTGVPESSTTPKSSSVQLDVVDMSRPHKPKSGVPTTNGISRPPTHPPVDHEPDTHPPIGSRSPLRHGPPPDYTKNHTLPNLDNASTTSFDRSPSPTSMKTQSSSQQPNVSLPSALRPRNGRRPSNAASTSSQIPLTGIPASLLPAKLSLGTNLAFSSSRPAVDPSASASPLAASPLSVPPYGANNPPSPPETPTYWQEPMSNGTVAMLNVAQPRREHNNNRVSFFDPANQALLDRLVASDAGLEDDDEGEEETVQATMASVEEMLEGYEWASDNILTRKSERGAADLVEARLRDELMALEKANIHSFLESDDRVNLVVDYMDKAIAEIDNMSSLVSSYRIHLNAVGDDIEFIQSQQRGLQVQTQNQRILLNELENLLETVQVDRESLMTLTQESLEKPAGIQRLEEAATELYKALQAGRDTDMAATMERLDEYRTHNAQFCKRIFDFLSIMITAQSNSVLDNNNGIEKPAGRGRHTIKGHKAMETYLGRYAGLMLYLKEMDESIYSKLCATYFSLASDLHNKQMKALLTVYSGLLKHQSEDDAEHTFGVPNTQNPAKPGAIRRAGTIVRAPMEGWRDRDKDKDRHGDGGLWTSDALGHILEEITPQVYKENEFIADFLQINDAGLTFADYNGLDNYFRRQATRSMNLSQTTVKLVRGAMDLIFGFLSTELKTWLDTALAKDSLQVVGVLLCLERFLADEDERGNSFVYQILDKQHTRLKASFDRHINQQIKTIEDTKLTSKKRKGVAHFIKYFPIYITRIESQLVGADGLEVRTTVDSAYEKVVNSMFDCLKHMATLDGEGEDKGQLNYHVILVENMHHFVAEVSQLELNTVTVFLKQAEAIYNENLSAYVKIVLRRPFAKIIDYLDGLERLLKTTAPTEVSKNSNYNKSALKKVAKEFDGKDVRKLVDILFKRVEKHFTEASEKTTTEENSGIAPGTVLVGVWKACEEELQRITEIFNKRIAQCYSDSGLSLEYTAADVEAAFRRHHLAS